MNKEITIKLAVNNGKVNKEASRAAFETAMEKFITDTEIQDSVIDTAVNAVFDKFPGKALTVPFLCGNAAMNMNAQPENHNALYDRIHTYIQDHSQGQLVSDKDAEVKVWANPESQFIIAKGVGVRRRKDIVSDSE